MSRSVTIAVLGASGATGVLLVGQALERGHSVVAVARDPTRIDVPDHDLLLRAAGDVHDPDGLAAALDGSDVVVSALGNRPGGGPQILAAGARAVVAAGVPRVVWLGAFGTGDSAGPAGAPTRALLRLALRGELEDKAAADRLVVAAGGTVLHAGPLTNGALSSARRTVDLADAPRRLFPRPVSRATVAAAMLDEAEAATPRAGIRVPLGR
ncbi:NAD(P)-dependent oxidoreductase [Patulibacter americanus]|uniref:NAD(P)-dependent oxidoreductase n=1 Tax=Patulibacter americanus TaxID=588672 RepID=UPI0003B401FA|nr:NAD(P)-binding oxidoreductase [Patulibacter americanus]